MPRSLVCTVVRCSFVLALLGVAAAWASTSTAPSPVVTFGTPGTKQVTLQVCNGVSCDTIVKTVNVLDAMPGVTSAGASPNPALTGGVVHLTGAGSGQPPLTYSWRILNAFGTQIGAAAGAGADWTVNVAPGVYTVYLDVGNAHGTHTSSPTAVTVLPSASYLFSDDFEQGNTNSWLSSP